ncbi:hypothetical protein V3C99_002277, partial [Haemonchus contortus]
AAFIVRRTGRSTDRATGRSIGRGGRACYGCRRERSRADRAISRATSRGL